MGAHLRIARDESPDSRLSSSTVGRSTHRAVDRAQQSIQFDDAAAAPRAEVRQKVINDPNYCAFTIRLEDRFGDHGLIAIVVGPSIEVKNGRTFHIDTWLMSCRVLNRQVEEETVNEMVRAPRRAWDVPRFAACISRPRKTPLWSATSIQGMGFSTAYSNQSDRREFALEPQRAHRESHENRSDSPDLMTQAEVIARMQPIFDDVFVDKVELTPRRSRPATCPSGIRWFTSRWCWRWRRRVQYPFRSGRKWKPPPSIGDFADLIRAKNC